MSEKETQARQPVAFTLGAEQYALSDQASAQARRQAADTADLVAQVASWMRLIADTVEAGGPGFADLAAAVDALTSQARSAARAIDSCLTTANRCVSASATAGLAPCAYDVAVRFAGLLERTLDAAVVIYGRAPTASWQTARASPRKDSTRSRNPAQRGSAR